MLFSPIFLFGFTLIFISSLSFALWHRLLWKITSGAKKKRHVARFLISIGITIMVVGTFKQGADLTFRHDANLLGFSLSQESRYVLNGSAYAPLPWSGTQVNFPNALRHARALVIAEQQLAWEEYACHVKNERTWAKGNTEKPRPGGSGCAEGIH